MRVLFVSREKVRFERCVYCKGEFTDANVRTELGWKETQISGICEICWDELFKDDGEAHGVEEMKDDE